MENTNLKDVVHSFPPVASINNNSFKQAKALLPDVRAYNIQANDGSYHCGCHIPGRFGERDSLHIPEMVLYNSMRLNTCNTKLKHNKGDFILPSKKGVSL